MRRGLLVALALATAVLVMVPLLFFRALRPVSAEGEERLFVVERGASLGGVANELEAAGLVRSARATSLYARWEGLAARLQAGEYPLSPGYGTRDILRRIAEGRVRTYPVVLPEGLRATEIAARLEEQELCSAAEFLALAEDADFVKQLGIEGPGLEGYLFPETYRFSRAPGAETVVRAMVNEFLTAWKEVAPEAERVGMSMREVVTLASIVEKETGAPEERPLIAAVFLNRMVRGMRLETDPTVIYGIENFDGNLRKRHLLDASNPYNTYRLPGLPPGPIANPGRDALRAVVEPAESDYLYFVSRNDGTHKFSRSYREHVNAVNQYQLRRRSK